MVLDESYQSRRLRWDVCFDQNAARNIQNTNSGLLERDVQCNVLIHDRSPGNKPQRQTWWHASRAESGRADYPMCENVHGLQEFCTQPARLLINVLDCRYSSKLGMHLIAASIHALRIAV